MSLLGGIELAPLIMKINVPIKDFKNDMEKVKTEAVAKTKEVSKQMEKTIKIGENMSKLGGTMTKALTVPIIGAGIAVGKLGMDMSESMGMVSTLLDGTTEQVKKRTNELKESVLQISNDTGVASNNIADGAYQVVSAFGDTADAAKILETAAKGAKASGATTTDTINLLSAVTKGYGDTSAEANQKASDLAFMTAKLGQTTFPELAGSIGKVVPLAENLKVSQEELFGVMATATGVTGNAAEVTTQFKGILQSLMAPTDSMTGLMKKLGYENGQAMMQSLGLQGTIDAITKAASDSGEPLQSYIGSIEGQTLALALSGAQHDTFTEKLQAMNDVVGATDEAFEKVNNTTGAKFKNSLNKVKNAAIKLGDALAPLLEKGANLIGTLAEKISSLSPEALDSIVKMGGMIAVAGPLLKVTGGLVQGYGKLKPLISGVTTLFSKGVPAVGKFTSSLTKTISSTTGLSGILPKLTSGLGALGLKMMDCSIGPIAKIGTAMAGAATSGAGLFATLGSAAVAAAPFVAAGAAITTAGYGIYKCLSQDVIPEVDLFADKTTAAYNQVTGQMEYTTVKISEETQKQVQSYIDLSNSAQQESTNMYAGITKVTDESVKSITGKVNSMAGEIVSATNTQRDEVVKGYQNMFDNTTVLTAQEQKEIMNSVNKGYDERVKITNDLKTELTNIYTEIANNGGNITKNQQQRIDQIYEDMKDQAVQAMAENEAEQNVILNRLSASNERVTAEMVGKSIVQMNELRDKSIQSAAEKRDALVLEAEKLKTLEGGKYKEKAQQIIDAANDEYEGSVKAAEKLRTEGINKLMNAHQEMADKVSVNTGEVISDFERWTGAYEKWDPKPKNARVIFSAEGVDNVRNAIQSVSDKIRSGGYHYNGLDYVPFDGYNARLHEGERVLTKKENEQYTKGKQGIPGGGKIVIDVPLNINDREFAHATKEVFFEELGFDMG